IANPLGNDRSTFKNTSDLRRRPTVATHKRRTKARENCEFIAGALDRIRLFANERQRAPKVLDRLRVCSTTHRKFASLLPKSDGFGRQSRFFGMMSEHLRLSCRSVWKLRFEGSGDPTMKLLPLASEQTAIGGISDQRVLEQKVRLRGRSSTKYEPRVTKARERRLNHFFVLLRNDDQEFVGEFAAYCS